MNTPKEEYIKMYQVLHAKPNKFPGHSIIRHAPEIKLIIEETNASTLLDYGCGKGKQYTQTQIHNQWGGILPTLYDPGVPAFNNKPSGTWDGVLCSDVMEHIPESSVDEVLSEIISSASKFVYFNISTRLATAILPNGENAHCTVHEHKWWEDKITEILCSLKSQVIVILSSKRDKAEQCIRTRIHHVN